ncbi:SDR family NAD(P)-dependent oxidoreductase [Microbacterium immunditiarum]|uniref:NAD(P)-dependent dehydrogenase (Short-subunit alcohol dehydrogenase family) n=1 Tax=Microbacterium immunditiarum TaxID=337480 RepID=A0A7Y9GM83_9MICO|nr:SDR family NAD(P)-dependent oxidoreductase [Microbacterium immunditiarum]NYE19067.1 NAD(P)-dependent dehydrogenase (short-subunit alcohol dehydrogenase family) [Microbacterium immunditiarum]
MRIDGTTALVTGGASGLGAATAASLAERGASVIALDLPQGVEKAEPHDGVRLVAGDVTSEDDVQAALDGIDPDAALTRDAGGRLARA